MLTKKLLTQGYRYHKLVKTFRKFCYKNPDLINKYDISVKAMLKAGLSKPQFYGDLLYKIRKIRNSSYFDQQFIKLIKNFKRKGYDVNLLKTTTDKILCKPTVDRFMFLFLVTRWALMFLDYMKSNLSTISNMAGLYGAYCLIRLCSGPCQHWFLALDLPI